MCADANQPLTPAVKPMIKQVPVQQVPVQQPVWVPVQQVPVQQVPVQQVPIQQVPIQQVPIQQVPVQQVPIQQPVAAVPQQPASGPLTVGSGTSVGNFASTGSQTAIDPFSGVNSARTVGAGPVGVTSGTGVNFGGIPGFSSLGSLLGGRRRRRRAVRVDFSFWNLVLH